MSRCTAKTKQNLVCKRKRISNSNFCRQHDKLTRSIGTQKEEFDINRTQELINVFHIPDIKKVYQLADAKAHPSEIHRLMEPDVKRLLDAKADPNTIHNGKPLLLTAVDGWQCGSLNYSLLLDAKADPNISSSKGATPLTTALYNNNFRNIELVKKLLDAKADPNTKGLLTAIHVPSQVKEICDSYNGVVPLAAISIGKQYSDRSSEMFDLLVKYGADPHLMLNGDDLFCVNLRLNIYSIATNLTEFKELLHKFLTHGCNINIQNLTVSPLIQKDIDILTREIY